MFGTSNKPRLTLGSSTAWFGFILEFEQTVDNIGTSVVMLTYLELFVCSFQQEKSPSI